MKIKIIICLVIVSSLFISPVNAKAPKKELSEYTTPELVEHFTNIYGSDYDLTMSVLFCESNFRMVSGDNGRSFGVAQYNKDTFIRHSRLLGEDLTYSSIFDQLKLVSFAMGQSEAIKREWTTYRAIKNGGIYIFTDKKGKTHKVSCKLQDW